MWPLVICVAVALGVSFGTLLYVLGRPLKLTELRRAFEALEEEFEELRDSTRSTLGRVSRLKRSIMSGEVPSPEAPGTVDTELNVNGAEGFATLTPRQQLITKQILARRRKA